MTVMHPLALMLAQWLVSLAVLAVFAPTRGALARPGPEEMPGAPGRRAGRLHAEPDPLLVGPSPHDGVPFGADLHPDAAVRLQPEPRAGARAHGTARTCIGLALGLGGALLIIGWPASGAAGGATVLGDLLTVGAAISWGVWTILAAPILRRHGALAGTFWITADRDARARALRGTGAPRPGVGAALVDLSPASSTPARPAAPSPACSGSRPCDASAPRGPPSMPTWSRSSRCWPPRSCSGSGWRWIVRRGRGGRGGGRAAHPPARLADSARRAAAAISRQGRSDGVRHDGDRAGGGPGPRLHAGPRAHLPGPHPRRARAEQPAERSRARLPGARPLQAGRRGDAGGPDDGRPPGSRPRHHADEARARDPRDRAARGPPDRPRRGLVPRAVLRAAALAGQDRPDRRGARAGRHPGDRRHRRPGGPPGRDRLPLHLDLARRGARVPRGGAGAPADGRHDRHARAQLARRARPAGHPAGGGRGPAAGHRRPRALVSGPRVPRRAREARRVPLVRPDGVRCSRTSTSGCSRGSRSLVEAGLVGHVVLSQDVCWRTDYVAYGGRGYAFVATGLREELRGSGSATSPTTG